MIKVKATEASKDKAVAITELGRIAEAGEEFEIPEERLEVLIGNNPYKVKFVDVVAEKKKAAKK